MPRKKGSSNRSHHHQGESANNKKKPVTHTERLRWSQHERDRLSALARAHPDEPVYRLAVERIERDEIEPTRRALTADRQRRRAG